MSLRWSYFKYLRACYKHSAPLELVANTALTWISNRAWKKSFIEQMKRF